MLSAFTGSALARAQGSPSPSLTAANVQWLAEQVRASRESHAELDRAITAHEAASLVPAAVPAMLKSGRAGGGGRGGAGNGMRPANKADLAIRPLSQSSVPQRVPKVLSSVVWDIVKLRQSITTNTSSIVETNYSVNLSSHPQSGQWSALYDQWCIPQFSTTFTSTEAPGGGGQMPELHTALDFDNTANIGSITIIDDIGSAAVVILQPGRSYTRSVRPCVNISGAVQRTWCDSAAPSINWNGIRSIFNQASGAAISVVVEITLWYAFRNSI